MELSVPGFLESDTRSSAEQQKYMEGYMMSWSLICCHFIDSSFKVRCKYLQSLSDGDFVRTLFWVAIQEFRLNTERPINLSAMNFEGFDLEDTEDEESKLERNTAFVFSHVLGYASSCVRHEWEDIRERVLKERIQDYIAKHFSPKLILKELRSIKDAMAQSEFDSDKVDIRVNEITAEVTTRYEVDEGQKIEMVIRLPPSYPLSEVQVIGSKSLGVKAEQWNKWLLTCTVACKNGTIVDALSWFVKNAQGYYAKLEECTICYGVLAVDRTLPTKKCPNGHWFHALCLFKWFKSSNGSSCPMCRATFNVS